MQVETIKWTGTVPRVCQSCGLGFTTEPNVVRSGRAKFCSRRCAALSHPRRGLVDRFWEKVDRSGDCWLWSGACFTNGYGQIGSGGRGQRMLLAHRVSYELHHGAIPPGLFVCHHCDNPPCVRPDHLFLADHDGNMADMAAKGRGRKVGSRGEMNGQAKLAAANVREIRERYAAGGASERSLARDYGVSNGLVHQILGGKAWRHV